MNFAKVIYFQLLKFSITNVLLVFFIITYYTLPHLILKPILSIFYILSNTKSNYLTNLQKVLKYFLISLRL